VTRASARRPLRSKPPGLAVERELWEGGHDVVAGVDEVGRGSWAGPLTVGIAVIPKRRRVYRIRDSKMLSESERERLFDRVAAWCEAWGVGHASPEECDRLGMSAAQHLAARRALGDLGVVPDRILVDGSWDFVRSPKVRTIVRGDATSLTIAAASILAKVTRDRIMRSVAGEYPGFDFARDKGYPGPRHRAALAAFGPTPIHRKSWAFMDGLVWSGIGRASTGGQEALFAGAGTP
jgi:ribonuclease HII